MTSGQTSASSSASAAGAASGIHATAAPAEAAIAPAERTSDAVALASMRTIAAGRSPSSEASPRRSAQLGLSSATSPSEARPKTGVGDGICKAFARTGASDSPARERVPGVTKCSPREVRDGHVERTSGA